MNFQKIKQEPLKLTLLVFTIAVIISVIMVYVVTSFFTSPVGPGQHMTGFNWFNFSLRIFFVTFNIVFLVALLLVYLDIYLRIKARFTLGLMIFIAVLLMQSVMSYPLLHFAFGYSAHTLGPFMFIPELLESIALMIFFHLSVE